MRLVSVADRGVHEMETDGFRIVSRVQGRMSWLGRVRDGHLLTHDGRNLFLWDTEPLQPIAHWPWDVDAPCHRLTRPRRARVTNGAVFPPRVTNGWPPPFDTTPRWIGPVSVSAEGHVVAVLDWKRTRLVILQLRRTR